MLLQVNHHTELTYTDMISESVMELRVAPRQEGYQHRLSFDLAIGPPTSVGSYFDWLGNAVHHFSINGFHDRIRIVATSVVEVDRNMVDLLQVRDRWPVPPPTDYTMFDYLTFGGPIVDCPQLRRLVAGLDIRPGTPLGELAIRLLGMINERFIYEKGITNAASPITDVLDHGKGVCQDFTHLFIGIGRALGIPSRYVSGLVHPEDATLRGATQTHAWCELFFPSTGWIALDPTNRRQVDNHFITIAAGRDFRDVPPNRGVYRGKATEAIDVSVTSEVLQQVPEELAADRVQPIGLPVYPGWARDRRMISSDLAVAQQQQQQQQA
jgi:transglutaminase-like putative cysteine protease